MTLREHNIRILNELKDTIIKKELSSPLLVSSNEDYINNLKNVSNIFYIGQETNGWIHSNDVETLEKGYLNFLLNNNYYKEYWKFINLVRKDSSKCFSNVLWSNTLICGKKDAIGTPKINDVLLSISLENLKYLYDLIKPKMTLIVSGPCNPYYEIITEFLKYINSSINGLYPNTREMIISDVDKNIHYTYHPNYLKRRGKFLEIGNTLNNYIK